MDFITLDFEIANRNYNSACSIGMVFVQDNKIIGQKYFVIRPPTDEMDPYMSRIHGLTKNELQDSPTFDEIWNKISHYFHNDTYIIAHNARFDMNVLKNCLITYNFDIPNFNYICNIPLSTRACRGEGIPNSLEARANIFGIVMDQHHNALSDARTVAEIILKCIELKRRKSIHTYLSTFNSIPIRSFEELKHDKTFKGGRRFSRVKVTEIIPETNDFNSQNPLFNKTVVFTGELRSISRMDAMQQVVNIGGIIRSGVSRKTNIVVVGEQDQTIVGSSGKSSKERKAEELIEQGSDIQIVDEDTFLDLLNSTVSN